MKIVTDTSTLYTPEEGNKLGITVLPLCVTVNKKTYREFVDIDSQQFLELIKDKSIPSSSQPPSGEFLEIFENKEDEILVISMADGLSGTYQSAVGMKNSLDDNEHIHIMNTKTLCGPHRYLVEKAIALKNEKKTLDEIKEELHKSIETVKSFLIPQDFDFLKRGGRLTPLTAKIGNLLKIVPILTQTEDGKRLEKYAVKRTMNGAVSEIIKHFKNAQINENYRIYISHAGVLEKAQEVKKKLENHFKDIAIELLELSPAFITQGGPECIAIQVIKS